MVKKADLTAAEETACREYIRNGGDQSAAFRVAYPHSTKWQPQAVWTRSSQLFAKDKVKVRLATLREQIERIALVEERELLSELAAMLRMDPAECFDERGNLLPIKDIPRNVRRNITSIKVRRLKSERGTEEDIVELKFSDKQGTMEKLGKHLGIYERDNAQKNDRIGLWLASLPPEVRSRIREKLNDLASAGRLPARPGTVDAGPSGDIRH